MKFDRFNQKPTSKIVDGTITETNRVITTDNPLGLMKKKSCTALLCELTCLRTQQKYLECSQVKLNPANFEDPPVSARSVNGTATTVAASHPTTTTKADSVAAIQLISEIENLKLQLSKDLKEYREHSYNEVQYLRELVNTMREDVQKPERLSQFSLPVLRERIININTQLLQLCDKNHAELERLREECEQLERENVLVVKF